MPGSGVCMCVLVSMFHLNCCVQSNLGPFKAQKAYTDTDIYQRRSKWVGSLYYLQLHRCQSPTLRPEHKWRPGIRKTWHLRLPSCGTLWKSPDLSEPYFPHIGNGLIAIALISQSDCEESMGWCVGRASGSARHSRIMWWFRDGWGWRWRCWWQRTLSPVLRLLHLCFSVERHSQIHQSQPLYVLKNYRGYQRPFVSVGLSIDTNSKSKQII